MLVTYGVLQRSVWEPPEVVKMQDVWHLCACPHCSQPYPIRAGKPAIYDGDDDPSAQGCTFTLLHFRQHSVINVEERRKLCWDKIVSERIPIPANSIKLYDTQGMTTRKLVYRDRSMVLHIPRTLPGHSASLSGHSSELLDPDHIMEHTSPTATRTLPGHSANLSGHSAELLGPDHTMEHTSPSATPNLPGHSASLSGHSAELLCPDHTMQHIPAATPSLHGTDHTMHTPLTPDFSSGDAHSVDLSNLVTVLPSQTAPVVLTTPWTSLLVQMVLPLLLL